MSYLLTHLLVNPYNWCAMDVWKVSNWNLEQIYSVSACFAFLTHILEWVLNTIEHTLNTNWVHLNAFEWVWTSPECNWVCTNTFEWVWTSPECNWMHVNAFEWVWALPECDWVHVNAFEWGLGALSIHKKHFWLIIMIAIVYYLWLLLLTILMFPRG
jgi:hypothetical protein